jgi:hypothetical protein
MSTAPFTQGQVCAAAARKKLPWIQQNSCQLYQFPRSFWRSSAFFFPMSASLFSSDW